MDFYRGLAYGLGEEPKFRKVDLFRQIQQGIERMAEERKLTPVFILDEMHMAKDAFLQDIALLFNFKMDSTNPFVLVLSGLPHLKTRLKLNHHRPLSQRFCKLRIPAFITGGGGRIHRPPSEGSRCKDADFYRHSHRGHCIPVTRLA